MAVEAAGTSTSRQRFRHLDPPVHGIRAHEGEQPAAWRHHVTVVVHAPAAAIAARIPAAAGSVEARDEHSCWFRTGADSLDTIAVRLGMLGVDFQVTEPPELVERIGDLGRRYARAVSSAAREPDGRGEA